MKKILVFLLSAFIIFSFPTGIIHAQSSLEKNMAAAVKAALTGPTKEFIKIHGHDFRVYKASSSKVGTQTVINGQLHHQIKIRPDDRVYYTIILKGNDSPPDIKYKIAQGGLMPLAAPLISAAAVYYTGKPISPDQVKKAGTEVAKLATGRGWEQAAEVIMFNIALNFQNK
jgi:hypothetical protein